MKKLIITFITVLYVITFPLKVNDKLDDKVFTILEPGDPGQILIWKDNQMKWVYLNEETGTR